VIGVVRHVRTETLRDTGKPQVYLPYHAYPLFDMAVVVKTAGDPLRSAAAVRREIDALGGGRPVHTIRPMEGYVADVIAESRFALVLLCIFAGLALVLSAIGLYGVVSYGTAQRTREIGVRVALGAARGDILRLVLGEGLRWTAVGVALGLFGSVAVTRYLSALLFNVSPTDPATMIGVAMLLASVAAIACYIPARRATLIEPSVALRTD
jgi:putative ABC transport system permease protein